MELSNRKRTRLLGYDYSSAGAYFITICAKKKKCLFSNIVGDDAHGVPQNKLTKIGAIIQKHILSGKNINGVTIDKYVIMPNHIHIILFVDDMIDGTPRASSPTIAIIPRFVAALKRFTNQEIGRNIFQRSYHDHIIRNEADYLRIWEYIENNPKQWELDCFYMEETECI